MKKFNRLCVTLSVTALLAAGAGAAVAAPAAPGHHVRGGHILSEAGPAADARFTKGTTICRNQALTSGNGRAVLRVQEDGNFVLYKDGRPVWQAPGAWSRGNCAVFQEDGNFVLYDAGNDPVWHSSTWHRGETLAVQDDGNVVIYDQDDRPVWATDTGD
ncbi:hypothetical protein ACFPM3_04985 [Streptomyces coeruleoprunus]|uniref:Bulb-type lectin domain-containing protein n=1 Tax=Streptomyces coeruleoprunus TaxID=285563 RepID=A0ABV9XC68_9ACTN